MVGKDRRSRGVLGGPGKLGEREQSRTRYSLASAPDAEASASMKFGPFDRARMWSIAYVGFDDVVSLASRM